MQPYPISRSWSGHTPFTVAAVPTGMNAGVRKDPRPVEIVPALASLPPSRASTVNRSVNGSSSRDEHRVAVTVEAVLPGDRLPVRRAYRVDAGERHHQGEKTGARKVKIRHQRVDRTEPVAGED